MEVRRRIVCLWLTFGFSVAIFSPKLLDLSVDICGLDYNCSHPNPSAEELERHIPLTSCPRCECYVYSENDLLCPGQEEFRTCSDSSIYSASSFKRVGNIVPMIDKCLEEANDTMNDLCSNTKWDPLNLDSYVVKGVRKGTNVFFRNMYCFQCNNGNYVEQLHLAVTYCESLIFDANTYSSVSDLLYHVEKASCEFGYETLYFDTYCSDSYVISACNVTGMWDTWDEEVNVACSTYEGKFLVFKNIFCYACNTGKSDFSPSIRSCINHEDVRVASECLSGPANPRTFPYWNEYCRKCNELPGLSYYLHHVNIYNKSAEYPFEGSVYFQIDFCALRNSDAYKFLTLSPTIEYLCNFAYRRFTHDELEASFEYAFSTFVQNNKGSVVDIPWTDLYAEYLRFGGKGKWWGGQEEECSHEFSCYTSQDCCPEVIAIETVECRELDGRNVTVVTSCPYPFSERAWEYYCERNESEMLTILDIFPFYVQNYADPYFRNVFCHMCNELGSNPIIQSGGYIHFKCKMYIDIENFLPLLNIISILGETCVLEFKSRSSFQPPSCSLESYRFDQDAAKCSLLQHSTPVIKGMKYMCEATGPYIFSTCKKKYVNIFCEMCILYSECEPANRSCKIGANVQNDQLCDLQDTTRKSDILHFTPMQFDLNISFMSRYNAAELMGNMTGLCTDMEFYDLVTVSGRYAHNGMPTNSLQHCHHWIESVILLSALSDLCLSISWGTSSRTSVQNFLRRSGLFNTLFTPIHVGNVEFHMWNKVEHA